MDFLQRLAANNNREWFNAHKDEYLTARAHIIDFADTLLAAMRQHDTIETPSGKDSLFRIYKDVRFAVYKEDGTTDTLPYDIHWAGGFSRATKWLRGSYYFQLERGNSHIVGGFWGPNAADMARIRQDIDMNYDEWNEVLSSRTMKNAFGGLSGQQLATAPRGYKRDHPAIGLLRHKQFLLKHSFADDEIYAPGFARKVSDTFKKMRPFLDMMSEILTTDSNGIPLA